MTRFEADFSEVEGLREILARAPSEVADKVSAETRSTLRQVATDARADAPRGTQPVDPRDGVRLVDSIETRVGRFGGRVMSSTRAGWFQELGTSRHPPQPWLTPAFERAAPGWERALIGIISELPR